MADTPEERLDQLFNSFEEGGVPSVRAELDLGRLGTNGTPSQTNAAAIWLKNKAEEAEVEQKSFSRKQTRRWLITTFVAVLALIVAGLAFILAAGQP